MTSLTGAVTRFGYNGDGARMLQTLPDGTKVVYVGGIEVSITGTTRITKTHYSAGAKLVAMRVITATGSALFFLHSDHLGSVSLTTDGAGAVVSEQRYTAWGVVWSATGVGQTDIGYTGQRLDATGLMYFQARYYSASLARFLSADTLVPGAGNPQGWNRYSYVFNSPLRFTDPSGHDPDWVERWNNARGRCREDGGWFDCAPSFWDEAILLEAAEKFPSVLRQPGAHIAYRSTYEAAFALGRRYVNGIPEAVRSGQLTGLEALARLSEFISVLADGTERGDFNFLRTSTDVYIDLMSQLLNGFTSGEIGRQLHDRGNAGYMRGIGGFFDATGFHPDYDDGSDNQPAHFWFNVQAGFFHGDNFLTQYFAQVHERQGGGSTQDLRLSYVGLRLGGLIRSATVNKSAVADWIRRTLSSPYVP